MNLRRQFAFGKEIALRLNRKKAGFAERRFEVVSQEEGVLPVQSFANPLSYWGGSITPAPILSSHLYTFSKSARSANINIWQMSLVLTGSRFLGTKAAQNHAFK